MTRPTKKDHERHHLDRFLAASGLFPAQPVQGHEVPDFLIGERPCLVGVEVVQYFRPTDSGNRPLQEQESLRSRLVAQAHELYAGGAGAPVRVSVHFSDYSLLSKQGLRPLAEHIARLVHTCSLEPWEGRELSWEDGLADTPAIDSLMVYGLPDGFDSEWVAPGFGWVPVLQSDEIQSIIDTKALRLSTYPTDVSLTCLLIVLDGFAVSSMVQVPAETAAHVFPAPFDRLFLFQNFGAKVLELNKPHAA